MAAAASTTSADFDPELRKALSLVEPTLSAGLELKTWLDAKVASGGFARRMEFVSTYSDSDMEPDTGFLFFDSASVKGKQIGVTGVLQRMFFDRVATTPDLTGVRESLKTFAMRYFLRVCENRRPETVHGSKRGSHSETLQGFGFSQWFYQSVDGSAPRAFPREGSSAVVDLREIGERYRWIAVQAQMYNYLLPLRPFGVNRFQLSIPMKANVAGFISTGLVINQDDPEPGVLGRYGVSFAMPPLAKDGNLMAFGPGLFDPCLHQMFFELRSNGVITAEARLVVNQPDEILRLPLDPIEPAMDLMDRMSFGLTKPVSGFLGALPWPLRGATFDPLLQSVDVANQLSGGQAAHIGISRDELVQAFLEKHFETDYFVLLNLLRTYRRVPDWNGEVPGWARTGVI